MTGAMRQAAIVSSMTPAEKENPKVLNASRKGNAGSGTSVQDVNRVLKMPSNGRYDENSARAACRAWRICRAAGHWAVHVGGPMGGGSGSGTRFERTRWRPADLGNLNHRPPAPGLGLLQRNKQK